MNLLDFLKQKEFLRGLVSHGAAHTTPEDRPDAAPAPGLRPVATRAQRATSTQMARAFAALNQRVRSSFEQH